MTFRANADRRGPHMHVRVFSGPEGSGALVGTLVMRPEENVEFATMLAHWNLRACDALLTPGAAALAGLPRVLAVLREMLFEQLALAVCSVGPTTREALDTAEALRALLCRGEAWLATDGAQPARAVAWCRECGAPVAGQWSRCDACGFVPANDEALPFTPPVLTPENADAFRRAMNGPVGDRAALDTIRALARTRPEIAAAGAAFEAMGEREDVAQGEEEQDDGSDARGQQGAPADHDHDEQRAVVPRGDDPARGRLDHAHAPGTPSEAAPVPGRDGPRSGAETPARGAPAEVGRSTAGGDGRSRDVASRALCDAPGDAPTTRRDP